MAREKLIALRLSAAGLAAVDRLAAIRGVVRSELVRVALAEFVKRHEALLRESQ